jgi:hypothetical protein
VRAARRDRGIPFCTDAPPFHHTNRFRPRHPHVSRMRRAAFRKGENRMKVLHVMVAALITAALPAAAHAERLEAHLTGYQEVPSVSTAAHGRFEARISRDQQTITYELTFSDVVGTVQQSHIHIAQRGVSGATVIWLCQTATSPAPAAVAGMTSMCPQSGKVTGTITAQDVLATPTTAVSQMIAAGELEEVIAAIRAGVAYVNVHATPLNPGGEIRGQIKLSDEHGR